MRTLAFLAIVIATQTAFGEIREVSPLSVRPTQAVVGYLWVGRKFDKFEAMSDKELRKELRAEPAPAVIGPDQAIYILDNHHEFYALAEMNYPVGYVDIIADMSQLSPRQFYNELTRRGWVYLGDENGVPRYTAMTLPTSIVQLGDDPYRALASFVRRAGGFEKSKASHAEFAWAAYFRTRVSLRMIRTDLERAIERGVQEARSPEAHYLPGYKWPKAPRCEERLSTDAKG